MDAFKKANFKLAVKYFERAKQLAPDNRAAELYLQKAQEKAAQP